LDTLLRQRVGLPSVAANWTATLTPGVVPLDAGWSLVIARGAASVAASRHIPINSSSPAEVDVDIGGAAAFAGDVSVAGGDLAPAMPTLRTWQPGDWLRLPSGGRQKLQDWFTDRRLPRYLRHHLPLLAWGRQVLWIAGLAAFPDPALTVPPCLAGLTVGVLYNGSPDDRAGAAFTL
jgi:tRNA(Ile)-lysidine synthetase-like protein